MGTTGESAIPIEMTARVWSGIDGTIDNVASLAAQNLDETRAALAGAIRRDGWNQVPWVNGEWPALSSALRVVLTRQQWGFVLAESQRALSIYEQLDDSESAQLCRDALAVVTSALG